MRAKTATLKGYTAADLAEVSDTPEITAADMAMAQPFAEIFPALAATIRRRGRQKAPTKVLVSLRLDQAVVASFRAAGPGWQGRINAVLRAAAARGKGRQG